MTASAGWGGQHACEFSAFMNVDHQTDAKFQVLYKTTQPFAKCAGSRQTARRPCRQALHRGKVLTTHRCREAACCESFRVLLEGCFMGLVYPTIFGRSVFAHLLHEGDGNCRLHLSQQRCCKKRLLMRGSQRSSFGQSFGGSLICSTHTVGP